jgi:hypothetical protein
MTRQSKQTSGDRKAAEAFVASLVAVARDDFLHLTPAARLTACRMLHDRFADKLLLQCSPAVQKQRAAANERKLRELKPEVLEALKQCERIAEMCGEVPERGEEFADSVASGVREIAETIQQQNRITADQQRALDNWESGVAKWIRE